MVRGLADPSEAPLRRLPREEADLHIGARYTWVLALDHVSYLDGDMSDALASIATGAGWAARKYYTDHDVTLYATRRRAIINGIGEIVPRDDLADRCLRVHLPAIPDDGHRDEATLYAAYDASRPAILGAIYDAAAVALCRLPGLRMTAAPRMADHAHWIAAAERALPWAPGADIAMLTEARRTARADAVEGSMVATAVRNLRHRGRLVGYRERPPGRAGGSGAGRDAPPPRVARHAPCPPHGPGAGRACAARRGTRDRPRGARRADPPPPGRRQ